MKLFKVLTLTLALNGIALPMQGMQQDAPLQDVLATIQNPITIEQVNAQRVQTAFEAYAYEAQWAPTVRYAALGAVTAIAVYGIYKWRTQTPPVMTDNVYTGHFSKLSNFKDEEAVKKAAKTWFEELQKLEKEQQGWGFMNQLKTSGTWVAAQTTIGIAASSVGSLYMSMSHYIPTAGNLQWYINARTDYTRNVGDERYVGDLQRYMRNYALYKKEIHDVMQLIVFDIEKITAYLRHFNESLAQQTLLPANAVYARATCQRYTNNITAMTNDVVDALNADEPLPMIAEKLMFMLSEVNSAKLFVNAYYR